MGIKEIWKELDKIGHEIYDLDEVDRKRVPRSKGLRVFGSRAVRAICLIFMEKELITFAVLQWVSIAVGYLLWVQMLGWIPKEVWKELESSRGSSPIDLVLLLWSFLCVGVAAFPLALSTACMGAVHFIHRQGVSSSIARCLQIVMPKAWSLWVFHWIDGWITVRQIAIRLPKKNDKMTPAQKALSEAIYYAWKIGTMGILPSLITGRSVFQAGKDSVQLVKKKFKEIALLRAGYSIICWIIGVATYLASIVFMYFMYRWGLISLEEEKIYSEVFTIYLWLAVPILMAVAVIQLFVRPIYILSLCDIYSDYLEETCKDSMLPRPPSKGISAIVAFMILCLVIAVIFLFRHELGIMDILAKA